MERIICDFYEKSKKYGPNNDFLKEEHSPEEAKQIIVNSINNMYGWLYEKGILEKISFEFKDYSDFTYFAFNTDGLKPYRFDMEFCGVFGADIATAHIFDVGYTPCVFSGAIQLCSPMTTYRDNNGCVGKSRECEIVQWFNNDGCAAVLEVKKKNGIKAAISKAFDLAEFEPSDIVKESKPVDELVEEAQNKAAEINDKNSSKDSVGFEKE